MVADRRSERLLAVEKRAVAIYYSAVTRTPMHPSTVAALWLALAGAMAWPSCKSTDETPPPKVLAVEDEDEDEDRPPARGVLGVSPDEFDCDSVATVGRLSTAVGSPLTRVDSPFSPPAGVAAPCNYISPTAQITAGDAGTATGGAWSFDIDCREVAIGDGKALLAQWATEGGSVPIMVGKSGVDHKNTVLLFIDDDSPCYARVIGPGKQARLAIAKLVADGLTEVTAPMKPTVR